MPFQNILLWIAAVLLGLLPFLLGVDFGGVLWWTHYVAAWGVVGIVLLVWAGSLGHPQRFGLRRHALLVPLALGAIYAWGQCLPLPSGMVASLSPASAAAYTDWVAPFLSGDSIPDRFPISLAADRSRHAVALFGIFIAVVWAAASVGDSRNRIIWMLSAVAIGASLHAVIGVVGLIDREFVDAMLALETSGPRFGTFVNRNNAALMMNLGIAAGLGLLSWRLTALTGAEVDDESFEVNDLIALVSDRQSMIGVVSIVTCFGGLLVCGSRGGLAAAVMGMMLALGWVRRRRGLVSLPVVITVLGIIAAILLVPTSLDWETVRRMEQSAERASTSLLDDGRADHWPDGWRAAMAHLPAGSGLGTYAYAYLPHQQTTPGNWHHHADNLWLELLVEQGLFGWLVVLAVLVIAVRSLSRLAHSPDPIDQGLRIAGWFALGVLIVSQTFDFGLILPANLAAVAILFAAVIARDEVNGLAPAVDIDEDWNAAYLRDDLASGGSTPAGPAAGEGFDANDDDAGDEPASLPKLHRRWSDRLADIVPAPIRSTARFLPGTVALAASLLALPVLRVDAWDEWWRREFDSQWPQTRTDEAALQRWSEMLNDRIAESPRAEFHRRLSDIAFQTARLQETHAAGPRSEREFAETYRATGGEGRTARLIAAGGQPLGDDCQDRYGYGRALEPLTAVFRQTPLDPYARVTQIHADRGHCDPERLERAIRQLDIFYRNSPKRLLTLGAAAAGRGLDTLATELWRRTLEMSPGRAERVAVMLRDLPQIDPLAVFPEDDDVLRTVGRLELKREQPNPELMRAVIERVRCEDAGFVSQIADCHQLKAELCYRLGDREAGHDHFRAGVDRDPKNVERRVAYIAELLEDNRFDDARELARGGRTANPDEIPRFDKLLEEIAGKEAAMFTRPEAP